MPEATTLKKTDFASPNTINMGRTQMWVGLLAHFPSACWNFVWLKLNSLYCWEFIFAPALVLHYSAVVNNARKYCFLGVIYPLWLLKSFLLLFHKDPWASGRGGVIQTTAFRLRIFQFFLFSAPWPAVDLYINWNGLQTKGLRDSLIYRCDEKSLGQLGLGAVEGVEQKLLQSMRVTLVKTPSNRGLGVWIGHCL